MIKKRQIEKSQIDLPEVAATLRRMNQGPIPSDVLGSYTGTDEFDEQPVQDADDL